MKRINILFSKTKNYIFNNYDEHKIKSTILFLVLLVIVSFILAICVGLGVMAYSYIASILDLKKI